MKQESKREIWKKKEPSMVTEKETTFDERSDAERTMMELASAQNVTVVFHKYVIPRGDLLHTFTVNMRIPLRRSEVMERMATAFPGLEIKTEEF
jgi:hypothetical protein